jgi:hypothetical protein
MDEADLQVLSKINNMDEKKVILNFIDTKRDVM